MRYLDLFSGVGGFHLGLEKAGFEFEWVGYSEIDKYAKQEYARHFPEAESLGDVTKISISKLPKIDIITFGFPCQDLSVAGKRKGLDGKRSGLFYKAMRIIEATKPKVFIFENVDGLYSSGNPRGSDFTAVLRSIAALGVYECEWQTLNTRWFLPQNRKRVYFIGHLAGHSRPKVFPFTGTKKTVGKTKSTKKIQQDAQCLKARDYSNWNGNFVKQINTSAKHYQDRIYATDGIAPALPTGTGGGHTPSILPGVKTVLTPGRQNKRQNGRRVKEEGEPSFTLTGQDIHGVELTVANTVTTDAYLTKGARKRDENGKAILTSMFERRIRRLTPVECARLQGFPDDWCAELSDTQAYKCFGNAVSVPVVEAIGRRLIEKANP